MYQKNRLKDLIYIQENKPCNEQTINGLFRSILEPVLEENTDCLVLLRLEEQSKQNFSSLLKRLQFSNAKVYDFSYSAIEGFENVLERNPWENTEFVFVLAERYGAAFIFDFETCEIKDCADIYIMHHSKNLSEAFSIINENSKVDLKGFEDKWHPERRENDLLNLSVRKIIENFNETSQEFLISQIEKEKVEETTDAKERLEFILAKSSYIAHEMRNLLSICNLYSAIIEKQQAKIRFEDEETKNSILNARDCIRKSLQMCGNLLLDFKSLRNVELKEYDLRKTLENAVNMAKIYAKGREIDFETNISQEAQILIDENKFLTVLINLIKNAVESMEEKGKIIVNTKNEEENVKIIISNDGRAISKEIQDRIFEEGFTTKASGSGLGLVICKKTLEELYAKLDLKKSDEISTEFEITVLKGGL